MTKTSLNPWENLTPQQTKSLYLALASIAEMEINEETDTKQVLALCMAIAKTEIEKIKEEEL